MTRHAPVPVRSSRFHVFGPQRLYENRLDLSERAYALGELPEGHLVDMRSRLFRIRLDLTDGKPDEPGLIGYARRGAAA